MAVHHLSLFSWILVISRFSCRRLKNRRPRCCLSMAGLSFVSVLQIWWKLLVWEKTSLLRFRDTRRVSERQMFA